MAKETDPLMPQPPPTDEENQQLHAANRRSSGVRTPFPISMTSALWAEFLGSFIFVQIGCGINCATLFLRDDSAANAWKPSALGWGLALLLAVYISAPISGGHVNPAVSLSFALVRRGKFSFGKILPYWMAQLVGAMVATLSNLFLFHQMIHNYEAKGGIIRGSTESLQSANAFADYFNVDQNEYDPIKNTAHAFYVEFFGAAFLGFAIFALTNPKNPIPGSMVPFIIAAAYGAMVASLGALTGAPLNPARDLGARLVLLVTGWGSKAMTYYEPYILGPLLGAPIGAWIADQVLYL